MMENDAEDKVLCDYDLIDAQSTYDMIAHMIDMGFSICDITRGSGIDRVTITSIYKGVNVKGNIRRSKKVYGRTYKAIYNFYQYILTNHVKPNHVAAPGKLIDVKPAQQIIKKLLRLGFSRRDIALKAGIHPATITYILNRSRYVRHETFIKIVRFAQQVVAEKEANQDN